MRDFYAASAVRGPNAPGPAPEVTYHGAKAVGGNASGIREQWERQNRDVHVLDRLPDDIRLLYESAFRAPEVDLTRLPRCSFTIQFTFTLASPYISRDQEQFAVIDNPIRTDRVLEIPEVASSTWKGSLRSALRHELHGEDDPVVRRLLGAVGGSESHDDSRAGRLTFFPTFFSRTALTVINPQERATRAGSLPITFQCAPEGDSGIFTLLYVPFDRAGNDHSATRREVAEDLTILAEGLRAALCVYGFGAKTSTGHGLADESLPATRVREGTSDGRLRVHAGLRDRQGPVSPPPVVSQQLPRYLEAPGRLREEYRTPDGAFRERSPAELQGMPKAQRQLYEKARDWWRREGQAAATKPDTAPPEEPREDDVPPPIERTFRRFSELIDQAQLVAERLREAEE